jgi:hypothetical protein
MIQAYKDALVCRLLNRRVVIFKHPELITLNCYKLQEVRDEESIEIIKQYCDWVRVIRLKDKTLVYSFHLINFSPDMFDLIGQTYYPLKEIQNYDEKTNR